MEAKEEKERGNRIKTTYQSWTDSFAVARVRLRAKAKDSLSLSRPLLHRVFKAIIQDSALKALQPGTQMKHLASRHGT